MNALDLVKHFEGLSLSSYQDEGGIWTIGYGCTGPTITAHTVWTLERAEAEVAMRVARTQHVIEAMLMDAPTALTGEQLAAVTSLAYNIGLSAFEQSTLRRKLLAGDLLGAANEFPRWNHVAGKVSNGLTKRRTEERQVFLS